jgi:hypothetical protein
VQLIASFTRFAMQQSSSQVPTEYLSMLTDAPVKESIVITPVKVSLACTDVITHCHVVPPVLVNVPTVVEVKVVVVISLVKFAGVGCPSNTAVNVLQSAEIVTLVIEVIAIRT